MILLVLIFAPLVAAIAIALSPREKRGMIELFACTAQAVTLACSVFVVREIAEGRLVSVGSLLLVDSLGAWFLMIVALIGMFASVYSVGYLREETKKEIIGLTRVWQYFILFELFLFAMLLAVSANYPILMWIAIEATTLSTVFLISFYNKPAATEAAWKYLLLNSLGLLLGLLGTMLFLSLPYDGVAVQSWSGLKEAALNGLSPLAAKIAFVFVLVGFGTKVGLAPMHTWLPDGHSKAPSPVSALLSGVLLNIAFLAILRFKGVADAAGAGEFTASLFLFFGIASIALSAFVILVQKNYKRLLAYSSIDHMGIAAIGFGFGGMAILPSLLHLMYHSMLKSLLFFSAGNIFLKYGSTKIANVRGALQSLPVTSVVFFGGSLALLGMPPFGVFMSKFGILSAGFSDHPYIVGFAVVFLAVLFYGFFKSLTDMVFGDTSVEIAKGESNQWTVWPVVLLAGVFVVSSWYIAEPIQEILSQAVSALGGN